MPAVLLGITAAGCSGAIAGREGSAGNDPAAWVPGSSGAGAGGASGGAAVSAGAGGGAAGQGASVACASAAPDTGPVPLRRLTGVEYQLTLQDLFALAEPPSIEGIPPDTEKDGFKTFAELQTLSAQHLRGYLDVAALLADELLADTVRRDTVIGCAIDAADCLRAFVTRFGKLAYRRPLDPDELTSITTAATDNALDVEDQYKYAIESLLAAPSFLYRVELGAGDAPATLGPYELASRLSFTLWGRAPSAALLDMAEAGALETTEGLVETVATMAADPRAQRFLEGFFAQWLGYEVLRPPKAPPAGWDDALLVDMAEETRAVVGEFAFGGRDLLDALTANTTRVSPVLADYYGLPAPAAAGLVEIPEGHPRAHTGLLTHGALISAKSDGDTIAKRGNWLRKTYLCRGLEVPPEIAETFGERLVGLTRTEIVRERNTDESCRGCHAMIDPIGIGFEAFDETGRHREGVDITPFGIMPALPDAPEPAFATIAELSSKLRALPEVSQCVTERVFLYTHGREPDATDRCGVERAVNTFNGSGRDFRALVRALVEAPEFRLRRAPEVTP